MGFERITHLCGKRVVLSFGNSAVFQRAGKKLRHLAILRRLRDVRIGGLWQWQAIPTVASIKL
jgi:hypothetical protein